ncbi:MAG: hypothetical protein CME68_09825 [Halobacteriovoraceae bacterium]|nr:hypothetical protein [Halobacteriovoraceae bacterium]
MASKFLKKTSSIMLTLLIGLIVISFMFSDYQIGGGNASSDKIGEVGNLPIKYKEYQSEYNRNIRLYSQYFGQGKPLSSKQIRALNIKDKSIGSLVNRKLMMKFGEAIGSFASDEEVKDEIKNYKEGGKEIFKTNGQFNVGLYKRALANARITPSDFEKDMKNQIKGRRTEEILSNFPISKGYLKDIEGFKSQIIKADLIEIPKDDLKRFLNVSKEEIMTFLSEKENHNKTKALYDSRKVSFAKPAKFKARHILLLTKGKKDTEVKKEIEKISKKITKDNFEKMAKKYTEDPSGKASGGSLPWFSKGQMVPAFEKAAFRLKKNEISKPVKSQFGYHIILLEDKKEKYEPQFKAHKDELAKELVQNGKKEETKKLLQEVLSNAKSYLDNDKKEELVALQRKYALKYQPEMEINRYDGPKGLFKIKGKNLAQLFLENNKGQVLEFDELTNITLVKVSKTNVLVANDKKPKTETLSKTLSYSFIRSLNQDLLNNLKNKHKVKIFKNF